MQRGPDLPEVSVVDRDTEHPCPAGRDPHSLGKLQLAEDEPEEEVMPGQDGDCEVRLSEDCGHLDNQKRVLRPLTNEKLVLPCSGQPRPASLSSPETNGHEG